MQSTNRLAQVQSHSTQVNGTNGHPVPPEEKPAGRDAQGRFAKGNRGGPGNPFARQIAGFRRALCNAVTEQDITELAQLLLVKAKGGDLLAMKLLFQYTLGRPTEAADPDSLDAEEMQLFQKNNAGDETMSELIHGTPAELALKVLRVFLPERAQSLSGTLCEMIRAMPEPAAEKPSKPKTPPPAPTAKEPSANGHRAPVHSSRSTDFGKKRPTQTDGRPMTNGKNGHLPTDGKPRKRRKPTVDKRRKRALARLGCNDKAKGKARLHRFPATPGSDPSHRIKR